MSFSSPSLLLTFTLSLISGMVAPLPQLVLVKEPAIQHELAIPVFCVSVDLEDEPMSLCTPHRAAIERVFGPEAEPRRAVLYFDGEAV